MNPRKIEILIMDAIDRRPLSPTDKWVLTLNGGTLHCVPTPFKSVVMQNFCLVTEEQCREGFYVKEWSEIVQKVLTYCKETGKCLNPLPMKEPNT